MGGSRTLWGALVVALALGVAGCGSTHPAVRVSSSPDKGLGGGSTQTGTLGGGCAATVLDTLGRVAQNIYHEAVASNRTSTALRFIAQSARLRAAVLHGDARASRAAVRALLATGHITALRVSAGGRVLASLGTRRSLAPLNGALHDAGGRTIGSFTATVQNDVGYIEASEGLIDADVTLRGTGHRLAGTRIAASTHLPTRGTIELKGKRYAVVSFPAQVFPAGAARVYVLRSEQGLGGLCGGSEADTMVNTISTVGLHIYHQEIRGRGVTLQSRRVEHSGALLRAVAARDPRLTRRAVEGLLNQHIVRLRVSAGGRLLADVGGPFVLAPIRGRLRLHGRAIGSFVLSIQDDMGYRLLAQRLAKVAVEMSVGGRVVMSTLQPPPAQVPARGMLSTAGHVYRTFSFDARAFPSGTLHISLLIPIPYT